MIHKRGEPMSESEQNKLAIAEAMKALMNIELC